MPGMFYFGTHRMAYLPNNEDGKRICGLLKIAFEVSKPENLLFLFFTISFYDFSADWIWRSVLCLPATATLESIGELFRTKRVWPEAEASKCLVFIRHNQFSNILIFRWGYPDDTYLVRTEAVLKSFGIDKSMLEEKKENDERKRAWIDMRDDTNCRHFFISAADCFIRNRDFLRLVRRLGLIFLDSGDVMRYAITWYFAEENFYRSVEEDSMPICGSCCVRPMAYGTSSQEIPAMRDEIWYSLGLSQ